MVGRKNRNKNKNRNKKENPSSDYELLKQQEEYSLAQAIRESASVAQAISESVEENDIQKVILMNHIELNLKPKKDNISTDEYNSELRNILDVSSAANLTNDIMNQIDEANNKSDCKSEYFDSGYYSSDYEYDSDYENELPREEQTEDSNERHTNLLATELGNSDDLKVVEDSSSR